MSDYRSILYFGVIAGFSALLTNVLEIILLARKGKRRSRPEDMILSLSISDMFIALAYLAAIIAKFSSRGLGGLKSTSFMQTYAMLMSLSICVSISHILVIAVERVYAVRFPLDYRIHVTPKLTKRVIGAIWVFAFVIVLVFILAAIFDWSLLRYRSYTGILILVTGVIISAAYAYLTYLLRARQSDSPLHGDLPRNSRTSGLRKQPRPTERNCNSLLAILLAAVYVVLSSPAGVIWTCGIKAGRGEVEWLIVINSSVNPVLYFWKSYYSSRRQRKTETLQQQTDRDVKAEASV